MIKSFQYRIYSNNQTLQRADNWLGLCQRLYNIALEQRISLYRQDKTFISLYSQINQLPELRSHFPEYHKVGSQVLEDVLKRLDKAYRGFFRRVKIKDSKVGFPRFKGRNRYDSFTLRQSGWKMEGKYLTIKNVGRFKIRLSRPIEGEIKTITIRRSSTNKWFVTFSCDNVPAKPLPLTGKTIGIDVGCESFLTTSNGDKIANPRFFKKSQDVLKMRNQRLSRREKFSNRSTKSRILVAKAHEKVRNQRRDFHFKNANKLIKENDFIFIEKMKSWGTHRSLNRSMRDVAWFEFFNILRFKAVEAGKEVIGIPAKDTSQLCSQCGVRVPKDLSVRVHSCNHCGLTIDRDHNAALNIYRAGQALQVPCTVS